MANMNPLRKQNEVYAVELAHDAARSFIHQLSWIAYCKRFDSILEKVMKREVGLIPYSQQ